MGQTVKGTRGKWRGLEVMGERMGKWNLRRGYGGVGGDERKHERVGG